MSLKTRGISFFSRGHDFGSVPGLESSKQSGYSAVANTNDDGAAEEEEVEEAEEAEEEEEEEEEEDEDEEDEEDEEEEEEEDDGDAPPLTCLRKEKEEEKRYKTTSKSATHEFLSGSRNIKKINTNKKK